MRAPEERQMTPSDLRIGHTEREAIVASLREHYAQGRLTLEEFNHRMDSAFAARTEADLARITGDLPYAGPAPGHQAGGRALAGASRPRGSWQGGSSGRARPSLLASLAGIVMVAAAIALVVSVFVPFALFGVWAGRPLVILVAVFAFGRRVIRWLLGGPPGRGRRRRRWPI